MALADIPKIPEEYYPRIENLQKKIEASETNVEAVIANALSVLGKVRISGNGIRAEGDYGVFEVDERALIALRDFLSYSCELLPRLFGKSFLIKQGDDIRKIKVGLGIKKCRATEQDIQNCRLPIVEFLRDTQKKRTRINIHRLEEFAGWLGNDWRRGSLIFRIAAPFSELLTKEILDKLGYSLPSYIDQFLKKCGV